MSITRRHVTRRGSMLSSLSQCMWLSIKADSRLCAAPIAWKSPVKCRLMSVIGMTCAYPPPAAPPFIPKQGPRLGSRRQMIACLPMRFSASPSPTVVVVLPSPAGVGETAVTRMSLPSSPRAPVSANERSIFALSWPYGISVSEDRPSDSPICEMGRTLAARAMSMSGLLLMDHPVCDAVRCPFLA